MARIFDRLLLGTVLVPCLAVNSSCTTVDTTVTWVPFQRLGRVQGKVPLRVGLDRFEDKRPEGFADGRGGSHKVVASAGHIHPQMIRYKHLLGSERLDRDPVLGQLTVHLTNEFLYNFVRSRVFEDVKCWYEPGETDLVIRGEIHSFSVAYKHYPAVEGITKGFYVLFPLGIPYGKKEVEIHLVFRLVDPTTGKEIARHEGKRKRSKYKNMYVSPAKLEDSLVKEIFEEFAAEIVKRGPEIRRKLS